jgi:hypothetical protein
MIQRVSETPVALIQGLALWLHKGVAPTMGKGETVHLISIKFALFVSNRARTVVMIRIRAALRGMRLLTLRALLEC